jgi:hypothetical protein
MVFALGRAVILWSSPLEERLSNAGRQAAIVHELVHLRRRDHWVSWFELLAECTWWWHPLFWYVRRTMREHAELACDAWVVAVLPEGRGDYARALVEVLDLISWKSKPVPALGMGDGAQRSFERRLTMILRERVPHRVSRWKAALIVLLLLTIVPAWSLSQRVTAHVMQPDSREAWAHVKTHSLPQIVHIDRRNPFDGGSMQPTLTDAFALGAQNVAAPQDAVPQDLPAASAAPGMAAPRGASPFDAPSNQTADDQLQDLESRLAELLTEVHNLRTAQSPARGMGMRILTPGAGPMSSSPGGMMASPTGPVGTPMPGGMAMGMMMGAGSAARKPQTGTAAPVSTETLIRAKYSLTEEQATTLAAFLQEHLGKEVETRVEGKLLVVTASPEAQSALAYFIRLFAKAGAGSQAESSPPGSAAPPAAAPGLPSD